MTAPFEGSNCFTKSKFEDKLHSQGHVFNFGELQKEPTLPQTLPKCHFSFIVRWKNRGGLSHFSKGSLASFSNLTVLFQLVPQWKLFGSCGSCPAVPETLTLPLIRPCATQNVSNERPITILQYSCSISNHRFGYLFCLWKMKQNKTRNSEQFGGKSRTHRNNFSQTVRFPCQNYTDANLQLWNPKNSKHWGKHAHIHFLS